MLKYVNTLVSFVKTILIWEIKFYKIVETY